jgi:hypothetical protein
MGNEESKDIVKAMWNVEQFCEFVRRSPYTAQRWRSEGTGPAFYKVGNTVLYDPSECREWVQSHRRSSTSDAERSSNVNCD